MASKTTTKNQNRASKKKSSSSISKAAIGVTVGIVVACAGGYGLGAITNQDIQDFEPQYSVTTNELKQAKTKLSQLTIRTSTTNIPDYDSSIMPSWSDVDGDGCPTRYDILVRDLLNESVDEPSCKVKTGAMFDYYTGNILKYNRLVKGGGIDIDHIVAKGNAWLSGGYTWNTEQWKTYINDEDVLIATSSSVNRTKGDKDASEWLPPNEAYHCIYATKQINIKNKYSLSISADENNALQSILNESCTTK